MKSYGVTVQMKPLQQYCHIVLTFESVDEILSCYYSNETSSAVLSHGTVCLSVCLKWNLDILSFWPFSERKGNTGTIHSLCNLPLLASSSQLPGLAHLVQLEWIHQMNQMRNLARTAWNCWVFQFWLLLTTRKNNKHTRSWNKKDVFLSKPTSATMPVYRYRERVARRVKHCATKNVRCS